MMNIIRLFILFILFLFTIIAKGQDGVPFRIEFLSTFPQWEVSNNLNGLQIVSRPLPGEPNYLSDHENKSLFIPSNDNFKTLIDAFPGYKLSTFNIKDIDHIPHTRKSNAPTWSHHALPTKSGGLAYRYLMYNYNDNISWDKLFHDYEQNLPDILIETDDITNLSPIEKYEYLVGNTNFTMTKNQWKVGQKYKEELGHIPYWIGQCHGTAPASLNSPRPINAIKLKSYNKKHDIIFYPSDIKELLAYAWANNASYSAIIGMRCGSISSYGDRPPLECIDTNPAAFHLAVLNLLGLNAQSFIIDASAGHEVWNRSIKSYRYKYFKPGTHNFTDKLDFALIDISDYQNDPFPMYRSSQTTSIVGVWMELTYIVGTNPSSIEIDEPKNDIMDTISFWYDLEIDHEGSIIGGEWHNEQHPDFLWVIGKNILPKSFYDNVIGNNLNSYDGKNPLSPMIVSYAKKAATKDQLLYSILERMLKISRQDN